MMSPIIGAAASIANDMAIPEVMAPAFLITRGLGLGLFFLFFLAETLRLQLAAVRYAADSSAPKPAFGGFLWRSLLIFVSSAFLYRWTFLKMVALCDHLALALGNEAEWVALIDRLTRDSNMSVPFFQISLPAFVGAMAFTALHYIEDLFVLMRFVILSLLYLVGPIAWAFGVSGIGMGAIRGWFKNTWHVSFWIVIFSLIKAAIVPLAFHALAGATGKTDATMVAVVYSLVVLGAIWMIPSLTAGVFSEANIGAVASSVQAIASYHSYKNLRATASHGDQAVRATASRVASAARDFGGLAGFKTPIQGAGNVLKGMFSSREASQPVPGPGKERTR